MTLSATDLIGSAGVLLTLVAYGLLHVDVWRAEMLEYSLANALGSALILVSLLVHWNFSAFALECCWLVISLYGIVRSRRQRKARKPSR